MNFARLGLSMAVLMCILVGCATEHGGPCGQEWWDDFHVAGPRKWAREHWNKNLAISDGITHYELDIDHDGVPELFLALTRFTGNDGCPQLAFKWKDDGYVLLGELFMHVGELRVLPLAEDGTLRVVTFARLSGHEGDIVWWTSKNAEFVAIRTEHIYPGDSGTEQGNRRYQEVFGE